MYATFNRFQIKMTLQQARSASHAGKCDDDVKSLLALPIIRRQFDKISVDDIRAELSEYGAWDNVKLSDDQENRLRIVWIAAAYISEERRR